MSTGFPYCGSCRLLASLVLLVSIVADTQAQGVADFEVPDRSNQVMASCNNDDLPLAGYDIAERIPDSNNCWWVKAALSQEVRTDVDPGIAAGISGISWPDDMVIDTDTTADEAFASARSRYQAVVAQLNAKRNQADRAYLRAFSKCGANVDCHYRAFRALQNRIAPLRAVEQKAAAELKKDLDRIYEHF